MRHKLLRIGDDSLFNTFETIAKSWGINTNECFLRLLQTWVTTYQCNPQGQRDWLFPLPASSSVDQTVLLVEQSK